MFTKKRKAAEQPVADVNPTNEEQDNMTSIDTTTTPENNEEVTVNATAEEVVVTPEQVEKNELAALTDRVEGMTNKTTKKELEALVLDLSSLLGETTIELQAVKAATSKSRTVHTADSGANALMNRQPEVGDGRRCPVTGHLTKKKRKFVGFGSDAKAKSVINMLLENDPLAEDELAKFAYPDVIRQAAADAREQGLSKVTQPTPFIR